MSWFIALGLAFLAGMVLPGYGLFSRWKRPTKNSNKIFIEDALKHLYDCEYKHIPGTPLSVAGALSISGDETATLLDLLERHRLVSQKGEGLALTVEGRNYALRVIRLHRLWERYLADETGLREIEWHPSAERQEHRMTLDEGNALAAKMGDPRYDPHGDPIPTSSGDLPVQKGIPLTLLTKGIPAQIVHVEDEPAAVYAQLVAQGLYPGVRITILDASNERISYEAEGQENVLAPIVASNLTVVPFSRNVPTHEVHESLASLRIGEKATVVGISGACRGQQRRRLLDLGVVPGTEITAELRSASGNPLAYVIRGATIALRKDQARHIHILRNREAA